MDLQTFASPSGRLASGPFALAATLTYILSGLSHGLLSAQIIAGASLVPFAAAQVALMWAWYVVHAKRLRDADRAVWPAAALAIVYGLGLLVILVLTLILLQLSPNSDAGAPLASVLGFYVVLYFLGILVGVFSADGFSAFFFGLALLLFSPPVIAFGFSIWAGTRPATAATPIADGSVA